MNKVKLSTKPTLLMSKTFFSVFLVLLLIFTALLSIYLFYEAPLSAAINSSSRLRYLKELIVPRQERKVVYGFLPYWNFNNFQLEPELTHLAYFGLDIAADGNLVSRTSDGNLEPGMRVLSSEAFLDLATAAAAQNTQLELVLKQFLTADIQAFLSNRAAMEQFLVSLDSILLAYPIAGINIDIEYAGDNSQRLRAGMTEFMTLLRSHLQSKYRHVTLSIDVYASAASSNQSLWDIRAIGEQVDYIIVMAYDFHQRGSSQAGPVAPLFSEDNKWGTDINRHLKSFLEQVPREKILLGIPFYGYAWQTDSRQARANTYAGSGFTVSYKKAKDLLQLAARGRSNEPAWRGASQIKRSFDEDALSPFITYEQDGKFYMIYYEDPQSIAYKLAYARQLDLAGVAIWALGYEDEDRDLWTAIAEGM